MYIIILRFEIITSCVYIFIVVLFQSDDTNHSIIIIIIVITLIITYTFEYKKHA